MSLLCEFHYLFAVPPCHPDYEYIVKGQIRVVVEYFICVIMT